LVSWLAGEILHRDKPPEERHKLTLAHALSRIDLGSILFFVGILLAVATLEHAKILEALAGYRTSRRHRAVARPAERDRG
jgi:Na+/H+ antiporter NhaD/arsenite permease-like protein